MRAKSILSILIGITLFAMSTPTFAQNNYSDEGQVLAGEAHAAKRYQRVQYLWNRLLAAYQQGDKGEIERVVKNLDDYVNRRSPSYKKKEREKMEKLAQRPEFKMLLNEFYTARHSADIQRAYRLNRTRGFYYSNPMLQDFVNHLGQSLVPRTSSQFYAFRIVNDPRPDAWALSTGSVYITTGLLAMLDNEAQLTYALGHEIGHIEHRHAYAETRGTLLEQMLEVEKIRSSKKKAAILGAVAAGLGAAVGGATRGGQGAAVGAVLGGAIGVAAAGIAESLRQPKFTDWTNVQEKDADEFAARETLRHNFDVREAPRLFAAVEQAIRSDARVGMAFHYGSTGNLASRRQHIQTLLNQGLKAEIEKRSSGGLRAASPEFALLMASVKRDNGILALKYDLFEMARTNLEGAVALRSSDPATHYHLGRVYKLTARKSSDDQKAIRHFQSAIRYDEGRGSFPEPHLEYALALLKQNDPSLLSQAQKEIKTYVRLYQKTNGGRIPFNIHILYDYLSLSGDNEWAMPPVLHVEFAPSADVTQLSPAGQRQ